MSESLLNEEDLTTADSAHPEKATVGQPSAIDDRYLRPGQAVPTPLTARKATTLFPDDELQNFRARWDAGRARAERSAEAARGLLQVNDLPLISNEVI
jgi:hypothetical protein